MKKLVGVDLGGTNGKVAVVTPVGRVLESVSFPASEVLTPKPMVKEIVSQILKIWKDGAGIKSIGIGVAGDVDNEHGVVRFSPNLNWRKVPLKKLVQDELRRMLPATKLSVTVENDANAAAWGAYHVDGKTKCKNLVVLTLGTGVGGGIVIDGKLYRGATGSAGEIGHMTVEPGGRLCNCGNRGCLEAYAGGSYMVREAKAAIKQGRTSKITEITPLRLQIAARQGDKLAQELWNEAGYYLGIAVAGVINLLNPELVVLAGGVSQAGKLLLVPVMAEIKKRAFETPARAAKVILSSSPTDLGLIGAALLAVP